MTAAGVCGGETQPLTVSASRFSEGRDEPDIFVSIHAAWIRKVVEWNREGRRYFVIHLGWNTTVFVDNIEEFMADLERAIKDREVVKE